MSPPSRFPLAPAAIARLPVNEKGFPIPWFVPWLDGAPDFRAVDPARILEAHKRKLCWICGGKLASNLAFVIGPMCCANRISAEPPSHYLCARFAVEACPFLSRPLAKRADMSDLPHGSPAGLMLEHNPGATAIWVTKSYRFVKEGPHHGLFKIGSPVKTEWYAEARFATRPEVMAAIAKGLPKLAELAVKYGESDQLRAQLDRMEPLLPPREEEPDTSDIPEAGPEWFAKAKRRPPP